MSLKHAILGFLSFKSLSGYDLKKVFDNSVRHFWPANQSQIYRTLAQMAKAGLLEIEVIKRDDRLDMKIYHLSEAGRAELHRWLATLQPPQDFREPFLIQVFFGSHLSDEELLDLLRHKVQATQEALDTFNVIYNANIARQPEDQRAFFLNMLTLDYGVKGSQAELEWLHKAIQQIETKTFDPTQL